MKKLNREQMFQIVDDTMNQMYQNKEEDNDFQQIMSNAILSMVARFMLEYQERVDE